MEKSGKNSKTFKKTGKTWKSQGNFLENQSTQVKLMEDFHISFQLDVVTMFGS